MKKILLKNNNYLFSSLSYLNIVTYIQLSILKFDEEINMVVNLNDLVNIKNKWFYLFEEVPFEKLRDALNFFISLDNKKSNYKQFDYLIKPQLAKILLWWYGLPNKSRLNFNNYLVRIYFLYIRSYHGYYRYIKPLK